MSSQSTVNELTAQLSAASLDDMKGVPNFSPGTNPVDIYRAHITDLLHQVTGVDKKTIYPAVAWTASLDKGDAIVAVPALRVKGKKPDELCAEWVAKVRGHGLGISEQYLRS
jgi:arginyl-tRNA synthetase